MPFQRMRISALIPDEGDCVAIILDEVPENFADFIRRDLESGGSFLDCQSGVDGLFAEIRGLFCVIGYQ